MKIYLVVQKSGSTSLPWYSSHSRGSVLRWIADHKWIEERDKTEFVIKERELKEA